MGSRSADRVSRRGPTLEAIGESGGDHCPLRVRQVTPVQIVGDDVLGDVISHIVADDHGDACLSARPDPVAAVDSAVGDGLADLDDSWSGHSGGRRDLTGERACRERNPDGFVPLLVRGPHCCAAVGSCDPYRLQRVHSADLRWKPSLRASSLTSMG